MTSGGRKDLQLASPALPVLISPLRTERLRCQPGQASQVSLTLQERGCSPVLFPQALPFGTPDTRPLLDIDSEPPPLVREVLPLPVEPSGQSGSELVHHSLAGAFLWAWPASLPLHGDTQEDSKGGFVLTLRAPERAALRQFSLSAPSPVALPQGLWANHETTRGTLPPDSSCRNWGWSPPLRARPVVEREQMWGVSGPKISVARTPVCSAWRGNWRLTPSFPQRPRDGD